MKPQPTPFDDMALRRRRAQRTALVVGAIALMVYGAFILSGVIGR